MNRLGFLLAFISLLPSAYASEDELRILNLSVSIWPEYDDPRVLVMFDGSVSDDVALPAVIRFPIAPNADVRSACAIMPSGKHTHESWNTDLDDPNPHFAYTLVERDFHAEYYYSPLKEGIRRSLDFRFAALHAIGDLQAEILEPLGAEFFTVSPLPGRSFSNSKGLLVHSVSLGPLKKGEEARVLISYEKEDSRPTTVLLGERGEGMGTYKIIITVAGVAGLAAIGYFVFRRRPDRRRVTRAGARRGATGHGAEKVTPSFCSVCGAALSPGDRFCRECGRNV